jgi:hypothetical protein
MTAAAPVRQARLAGEVGGSNGFISRVAAGGVGQQEDGRIDVVEQRFPRAIRDIHASDGNGYHVGA